MGIERDGGVVVRCDLHRMPQEARMTSSLRPRAQDGPGHSWVRFRGGRYRAALVLQEAPCRRGKVIAGPDGVFIRNECVALCRYILDEELSDSPA